MAIGGQVVAVQSMEINSVDGSKVGEMTELWDITEERREKRQWEDFVVMMTHDLKSPLTVMKCYIQGIRSGMYGEISSQIQSLLEEVEHSGAHLNSMIEDMLDSCRLELGLLQLNRQYCDMLKFLQECYRDNLRAAQDRGLSLVMNADEGVPGLVVDGKQLVRVFNNLISNAIKFTPPQGQVSISARIAVNALHVSVADSGIGIPPEDLSRVFNKYYRSAGAAGYKGSGLGLAISKAIVEAHDGSIFVESTIGKGSRFTVSLPLSSLGMNDQSLQIVRSGDTMG
jgi:signal transduction histidine kinase